MSVIPTVSIIDRVFIVIESLVAAALTFSGAWYIYKAVTIYPEPNYYGICAIALALLCFAIAAWWLLMNDIDNILHDAHREGWNLGFNKLMGEDSDEEVTEEEILFR